MKSVIYCLQRTSREVTLFSEKAPHAPEGDNPLPTSLVTLLSPKISKAKTQDKQSPSQARRGRTDRLTMHLMLRSVGSFNVEIN